MKLAFDTTHSKGSICISTLNFTKTSAWELSQSHAEVALSYLDELLAKNNLSLSDIKELLINHGPGSFTGIRISVNIVKTLSYTHQLPIFNYNSLDVVAHTVQVDSPLIVALNAHSNLCYLKTYNVPDSELDIKVLNVDQLKKLLSSQSYTLAGEFFYLMKDSLDYSQHTLLPENAGFPSAEKLLALHNSMEAPNTLSWEQLNPFYVRKSSPEEKLNS